MSPNDLREDAKKGDLSAISCLVHQAFAAYEIDIRVEAKMQWGVTLWLKLRSDRPLNSQKCLNIISRALDSIKPEKIISVKISETSPKNPKQQVWNKYLALKRGRFVDDTKAADRTQTIAYSIHAVASVGLLFVVITHKPTETTSSPTASTSSFSTASPIFLGRSETGYELWADKSCVYVKGITEVDLARLNTNGRGFRDVVKAQTGYKCVLLE